MKPSLWLYVGLGACVLSFLGGYLSHRPGPSPVAVQVAQAATKEIEQQRLPAEQATIRSDRVVMHTIAKYDTVRHTFEITDTTRVRELINTCDELRNSCLAFRDTARFLLGRDSAVFRAKDREIDAWKASQPSRFAVLANDTKWLVVGAIIGRVAPKVSVFHLTF